MSFQDLLAAPVTANVFLVTAIVKDWRPELELGKWYFAHPSWTEFTGPYDSKQIANHHFQQYLLDERQCPSCEE